MSTANSSPQDGTRYVDDVSVAMLRGRSELPRGIAVQEKKVRNVPEAELASGKFVVSRARGAYDAQARGPNRKYLLPGVEPVESEHSQAKTKRRIRIMNVKRN